MVGKLLHGIASSVAGGIIQGFAGVRKTLVDSFGMVVSYHNESMKFARSAGMSLQQAHAYTKVLTTRAAELGQKYGLAASEVQNLERNLQNAVSRQLMLSDDQAEKMVQINRLVGEGVSSTYSEQMVSRMGAQIDTVQGAIAKAYGTAMKSGLNAEKMTQKISQNLSMANRLSFRNGIDGLTRMAMLSEKMGMNMQSVESAAGNFMELDKAIENAAHLQMLGGSAAAMFGNPLTAAYEANYDPEAFTKRMSDSLATYATFDASKGISNINGMNMDFVRNIAKAMGISTEEAASMAKKQAEVRYKENTYGTTFDVMSGGDQMKRDMLINKSTIQNGRLGMVSMKDNKFHEMSYYQSGEGKKEMDEMMAMYGKSDSEIMMDIASTEKTINEQIHGFFTSISGTIGKLFVESGIMPKIQNFIDEKGAMLVQKVSEGVDWMLKQNWEERWKQITGWVDTVKSYGDTIITVLKWGFGLWVAGKVLGGIKSILGIGKGIFGRRGASAGASGGSSGGGLWKGIKNGASAVGNALKNGAKAIGNAVSSGVKALGPVFKSIGNAFTKAGQAIGSAAKSDGTWIANAGTALKAYGNFAVKEFQAMRAAGNSVFKSVTSLMKGSTIATNSAGRLYSTTTGQFVSKNAARGIKLAKIGGGVLTGLQVGISGYQAYSAINSYGSQREQLNQALQSGQISQDEYNSRLRGAQDDKNKAVGGAVGSVAGMALGTALAGPIGAAIGGFIGDKVGGFIGKNWNNIKDGAKKAGQWLSDKGKQAASALATGAVNAARGLARGAMSAFSFAGRIGSAVGKAGVAALKWAGNKIIGGANKVTALVTPKPTGGREYIYNPGNTSVSNVNGNKITVKDFNVNISGTIKIDAGRNFTNIDASTLLRDQAFVNQLKNVIKDSINNDMNGGRFMNDPATRRGQVSSTSVVGKL